ncbi:MAG: hypothetical protein KIT14_10420 [bacterium]|nr:hypothetical protein [bacterium]
MGDDAATPDSTTALEQLQVTLTAALSLATDLSSNALLQRLLAVFRAMPADDRPVIMGVLEREVLGRLLARGTERNVGQTTHPNPNARLYVRAHESDYERRLFDRKGMMIADVRAMRIAPIIRDIPAVRELFREAMAEALGQVEPHLWSVAEDLLHDVLGCIADARAAARPPDGPSDPPVAGADPDPPPSRDTGKRRS